MRTVTLERERKKETQKMKNKKGIPFWIEFFLFSKIICNKIIFFFSTFMENYNNNLFGLQQKKNK